MLAAFQRMTQTILATFGEDSVLRGSEPCRVNIEHGVQVTGPDGFTVTGRSIATISMTVNPKVDDVLVHPEGRFKLDAETANNGCSRRFIVLPLDA